MGNEEYLQMVRLLYRLDKLKEKIRSGTLTQDQKDLIDKSLKELETLK